MKNIRLLSISVENFKGCDRLSLRLDGKSASIFGDNATGKTTICDALTWLLFGRDSRGQSNFDIKPLDADGQVKDRAAITSVEAVLSVESAEISLKKTYFEKWSTKRGSSTETFDGNTSDYFVDGVPVKKYEFEERISALIDENVFRLLTGSSYFCADLGWQERRKVLFDVCGITSDKDIMSASEAFTPLIFACGNMGLDDYKKKLLASRKGLSGVRNDVPTRLDECKKTVEELQGIDFHSLQIERDMLTEKRQRLSTELMKLEYNTLLDAKRNERARLHNQLSKLENDNGAFRQSQVVHIKDDGPVIRAEIESHKRGISRLLDEKRRQSDDHNQSQLEVQACRDRWAKVNGRQFSGASCPTCGQTLAGSALKDAAAQFDLEKKAQLEDIVRDSDRFKVRAAASRKRTEEIVTEVVALENQIAALSDELASLKPTVQPAIADLPEYAATRASLTPQIEALDGEIAALQGESKSIRAETQAAISSLTAQIASFEEVLAKRAVLDYTNQRMATLREEAKKAAEEIERLDKMLFLCDEFTRYKVKFIEDSVNAKFRAVKFRLFVEQVNGGLADCCDATVGGVPYASLNSGARTNAGLDVICALSTHYGITAPLFVDNAESVTTLLPMEAQIIRLVVSPADKELRCEYGA